MRQRLHAKPETTSAKNSPSGCLGSSLFPNVRPQRRPRPSITAKLAELIGTRKKSIAHALRPDATIDTAEAALDHAISGSGRKRIGVDEIDIILDELGTDAEAAFMRWFCERRQWKQPERMTSREWALMELTRIRESDSQRATVEAERRDTLDRIEAVLREGGE